MADNPDDAPPQSVEPPSVEPPSGEPPRIEQHEAVDRFGKKTLRTVHDLGAALAETGAAEPGEPVVVRTGGPHRTLAGLAALIDAALEEEPSDEAGSEPEARRDPGGGQEDRRDG